MVLVEKNLDYAKIINKRTINCTTILLDDKINPLKNQIYCSRKRNIVLQELIFFVRDSLLVVLEN